MSLVETFQREIWGELSVTEVAQWEDDLASFVHKAWDIIDPGNRLVWGYPMDAICDHLMAVDSGHIRRLLMSVPPGFSKSTITNICYPLWAWLRRPHLRFICASYSEEVTIRDNNRCRRIITSEWYQQHWGDRVKLVPPTRSDKFENAATGWKLATSVGGQLLGQRADTVILDDPNSPKVESDAVRTTTNRWFSEVVPTRLNDMERSAIVVIQQRLHLEDVTGIALGQTGINWVHLNIPMEYEPRLYMNGYRDGSDQIESFFDDDTADCTDVFWADWRTEPGELAWPERFSRLAVDDLKVVLGPTAAASQLQQYPIPRGGAIIKSDWWKRWPEEPFPPMTYLVASLDTAYTEKKHNDPSACTVWGCSPDENGNPRVFLLWAWQEHLQLHDLVTKIIDTCTVDQRVGITGPRFPCHKVLIEDAASGQSVAQELYRLLGESGKFGIDVIPPRLYGDKVARLYSIEHVFAQGIVYAHDRAWADKVIQQCASVPYTSEDHLADSTAQAIRWLRERGFAPTPDEVRKAQADEVAYRPKLRPLYPA